jgi:hypothetical protein
VASGKKAGMWRQMGTQADGRAVADQQKVSYMICYSLFLSNQLTLFLLLIAH